MRRGESSVMNSAVATATGIPSSSAIADVMSVPASSGSAPYSSFEGTQSAEKRKSTAPTCWKTGSDSITSRMKKYAIRTMTPTESAVRPHFSSRSGSRAAGERCSAPPRSPTGVIVPASIGLLRDRRSVADQRVDSRLRSALDAGRQRRVLQVRRDALALAEDVREPRLQASRRVLRDAGSAGVLPDDLEGDRGDRVASRA